MKTQTMPFFLVLGAALIVTACDENNGNVPSDCPAPENLACLQQLSEATASLKECWKHESACPESASACGTLQPDGTTCKWPDGDKLTGYNRSELKLVLADGTSCYASASVGPSEQKITIGSRSFRYLIERDAALEPTYTVVCDDGTQSGPLSPAKMSKCAAAVAGASASSGSQETTNRELYCCSAMTPPACPPQYQLKSPVADQPPKSGGGIQGESGTTSKEGASIFQQILRHLR